MTRNYDVSDAEQLDFKIMTADTERIVKMGKHELEYKGKLLVGMAKVLPPFNKDWPIETQQDWYECHRALITAGLNLAEAEDELSPDEHKLLEAYRAGKLETVLRITLQQMDNNR